MIPNLPHSLRMLLRKLTRNNIASKRYIKINGLTCNQSILKIMSIYSYDNSVTSRPTSYILSNGERTPMGHILKDEYFKEWEQTANIQGTGTIPATCVYFSSHVKGQFSHLSSHTITEIDDIVRDTKMFGYMGLNSRGLIKLANLLEPYDWY